MRFLIKLIVGMCCGLIILGLIRRFMIRGSEYPKGSEPVCEPEAVEAGTPQSDALETTPPVAETLLDEPSPAHAEDVPEARYPASEESETTSPADEGSPPESADTALSDEARTDNDQGDSTAPLPCGSGADATLGRVESTTSRGEDVKPHDQPGRRIETGEYYPPTSTRLPTASLRCREGADGWELYLDIPEDRDVSEITQNEAPLSHDGEVVLSDFIGSVEIAYGDGGTQSILLSAPLYFRTDQAWSEPGRLAVQISDIGSYVIIAPVEMDGEFRDSIHALEECADPDFHAHFVDMGERDEEEVAPGAYPMRLTGRTLDDDADQSVHGEIFVGSPPELVVSRRIGKVRVVRETGDLARNDWGENFNPHERTLASVLGNRDGRFGVRTYLNGSSKTYESRPFRYFRSLERITLGGELHGADMTLVPDRNKSYQTLKLRFCCGDGSSIVPRVVEPADRRVHIWGEEVSVPPRPDVQTVSCRFENQATIEVIVPRVWWKFSDDELEYANRVREIWLDNFKRLASDGESFEVRLPQSVDAAHIGFDDNLEHRARPVGGVVRVDFLDLVDDIALEMIEAGQKVSLYIQMENEKVELMRIHRKLESVRSSTQ